MVMAISLVQRLPLAPATPDLVNQTITWTANTLAVANVLFPVASLLQALAVVVALEVADYGARVVLWALQVVRILPK